MYPEELNNIILHAVPNSWAKKAYIQGWYFERRSYKETCDMFKRMEIVEAINKGVAPSKSNQWVEADRASFCRKQKGVGAALPSKP